MAKKEATKPSVEIDIDSLSSKCLKRHYLIIVNLNLGCKIIR